MGACVTRVVQAIAENASVVEAQPPKAEPIAPLVQEEPAVAAES